ncbi:MAG: hypothetical protein ABJE95_22320 [Byssovorax sp.]
MILEKESLDAVLRDWPAPGVNRSEAESDEGGDNPRADAILRAATSAARGDEAALAALMSAPLLDAEPGEPSTIVLKEAGGDKKMAQDNESGEPTSKAATPSVPAPVATERKRTSLKAMAEKANQAGSRPSVPGAAPSSLRASLPPASATVTPLPSRASVAPASRPVEAKADDSGIINMAQVNASATPAQIAAAEKAKPGQADLFEDEKKPAAAAVAVAAKPAVVTPIGLAAAPKKSNASAMAGLTIAVLGLAAAFALTQSKSPPKPTLTESKPTPTMEAPAPTQVAPVASIAAADPAPSAEPSAVASADPAPRVALSGPMPTAAASAVAAKDPTPVDDSKLAGALGKNGATGKPGDLQSEMIRAAGGAKDPAAGAGTPEPAAGNPKNQNIPEQPSQGSVQAAIGAVIGGAKACVAGADDISRANISFGSSGAVSSVSVSGWAAAHGKTGCVQAALKAAKVGPFSKSTYSVGVPIRP